MSVVLASMPSTAPSVRRCLTTRELVRLRADDTIPLPLARHLVAHLSHPCAKCWKAVDAVGKVVHRVDDGGIPVEPEGWAPSTHPVVLALRAVGDWPPRRWLATSQHTALDGVHDRLGFLALVLETCRRSMHDAQRRAIAIESWSQPLDAVVATDRVAAQVRGWALVWCAEAGATLDPFTAARTLDRAEHLLEANPASDETQAASMVTRAKICESRHPQLARAYLELAADRLVSASGSLRAEIYLELAELHIRHGEPHHAGQALGRAAQLLGESNQPVLSERLKRERVRWSLLVAAMATPGIQRFVAHTLTLGRWSRVLDLPRALDPRGWHDRDELRSRLRAARNEHSAAAVREALGYLGTREDTTVAFEADLRVVLAATLPTGDPQAAEQEIEWLRQTFSKSPGLFLRLERARDALSDALEAFPMAEVQAFAGPLLAVLERLREPVSEEGAPES